MLVKRAAKCVYTLYFQTFESTSVGYADIFPTLYNLKKLPRNGGKQMEEVLARSLLISTPHSCELEA